MQVFLMLTDMQENTIWVTLWQLPKRAPQQLIIKLPKQVRCLFY